MNTIYQLCLIVFFRLGIRKSMEKLLLLVNNLTVKLYRTDGLQWCKMVWGKTESPTLSTMYTSWETGWMIKSVKFADYISKQISYWLYNLLFYSINGLMRAPFQRILEGLFPRKGTMDVWTSQYSYFRFQLMVNWSCKVHIYFWLFLKSSSSSNIGFLGNILCPTFNPFSELVITSLFEEDPPCQG